jgi:hypothetical protein
MAKKKTPDPYCSGKNPDCSKDGRRCAGHERGSCSGFVCITHQQTGTAKPFVNKIICRICAQRQNGTLASELDRKQAA